MVRFGSPLLLGAALGLLTGPLAAQDDNGIKNSIALQTAMGHAKHYLQETNEPGKAVAVLEEQLSRVNGNPAYLRLLRDAYRAHVVQLWAANQPDQAQRYLERLCILDPAAASDASLRPQPTAGKAPAPPPPAERGKIFPNFALNNPFARKTESTAASMPMKPSAVRGQVDDPADDPFDPSNRRGATATPTLVGMPTAVVTPTALAAPAAEATRAGQLVARAEEEFGRRKYAEARVFYEQAYQADRASVAGSRERWAYCMLNHVVEQMNQPARGNENLVELQQQVQTALAMAPNLAETGTWLQREIEQRGKNRPIGAPPQVAAGGAAAQPVAPQVPVQHLGRNPEGWLVTETPHFRIFHHLTNDVAEKVGQAAERTKLEMSRKWFGADGETWQPKCELILHADAASYTQMTGVPTTSPGHSRIETDRGNGRVIARRMDLRLDNPGALDAVLPHEATHDVLAGQFGSFAVPRCADEGIAFLAEPA